MTGHAPLRQGYLTGDPGKGWRLTRDYTRATRDLPNGGRLEIRATLDAASTTSYEWRHVPPVPGPATPWAGLAPTLPQAALDASHHADLCAL